MDMEQLDQAVLATLHGKIDRINDNIDAVKEKQEEMSEHVSKIKEAVYNPDSGLYARLRSLEQWRDATARNTWFLATAVGGLILKTFWDMILS